MNVKMETYRSDIAARRCPLRGRGFAPWLTAFVFAVALLASCGGESEAQKRAEAMAADSAALKIATMPTLDCLPLYVARQYGLHDSLGIDMRLVPFVAQMDQDTAMLKGRVEAMFTDTVRAGRMERVQHKRLRRIVATPLHWLLMTPDSSRVRELKQIDDKLVAMTRYSATDMLTRMAADSARTDNDRIYRIQVNDVHVRYDMMMSSMVDAAWLPEPHATVARKAGCRQLFSSRGKLETGVLVVSDSLMSDSTRRWQVERMAELYNRGVDSIARHGLTHYASLISQYCGVEPDMLSDLPKTVKYEKARPAVK